jgi:hypothetical protein
MFVVIKNPISGTSKKVMVQGKKLVNHVKGPGQMLYYVY